MKPRIVMFFFLGSCLGPAIPPTTSPTAAPVQFLVNGVETAFRDPQVLSIDDSNQRFHVVLAAKSLATADQTPSIALTAGDQRLEGTSWGSNGDEGWFVFRASPTQARRFADALGVPTHERAPWRASMTGRLEPSGDFWAGAANLALRFTLTNTASVTFWFMDGGRGRNELGRDNRFRFEVERDGERVATREIADFGGMGSYRKLDPGESHAFEIELLHWLVAPPPGKYVVRASYEADLMPAEFEPTQTLPIGWSSHLQRSRSAAATVEFELR